MTRTWMTAAAVLGLAVIAPGCASGTECAGASSIDQGVAAGRPSARAALDALLTDRPKWLDQNGWLVGRTADEPDQSVTFVAGARDSVKVFRSALNGRWYLDSYQGCR
jgi:hypothetical protein